jgi:glycosyltransferase involved in cell wall biosynthesis
LAAAWGAFQSPAQLLFAGPSQDWTPDSLRSRLSNPDDPSVSFIPAVDRSGVAWCLSQAGIFVLPSENENFGIAVAEAMTYGCAVLSTSATAATEHVAAANSGVILTESTSPNIRHALDHLLLNPETVRKMGDRGAQYARQKLTWEATARLLQSTYLRSI